MAASEKSLYLKTIIFSVIVFAASYYYIEWLGIPRALNKAVADTAILVMGLSMLLSSVCYFWDQLDWAISYRKHLGLVGFMYGIVHVYLTKGLLFSLFDPATWSDQIPWAPFTGFLALVIFTVMALISNTFMAKVLGGKIWKYILRTGYAAVIFVWLHVMFLKGERWLSWFEEGMPSPPSLSLLVSIFMIAVIVMRLLLWLALIQKRQKAHAKLYS